MIAFIVVEHLEEIDRWRKNERKKERQKERQGERKKEQKNERQGKRKKEQKKGRIRFEDWALLWYNDVYITLIQNKQMKVFSNLQPLSGTDSSIFSSAPAGKHDAPPGFESIFRRKLHTS